MAPTAQNFDPNAWQKRREGLRDKTRQDRAKLEEAEKRLVAEWQFKALELSYSGTLAAEPVEPLLLAVSDTINRCRQIRARVRELELLEQAELKRLAEQERLRIEQEARERERARAGRNRMMLAAAVLVVILATVVYFAVR